MSNLNLPQGKVGRFDSLCLLIFLGDMHHANQCHHALLLAILKVLSTPWISVQEMRQILWHQFLLRKYRPVLRNLSIFGDRRRDKTPVAFRKMRKLPPSNRLF